MNSFHQADEPLRHYSYWRVFMLLVAGLSFVLVVGLPVTGYNLINKFNQIIFQQIIKDNNAIADFFVQYLLDSRQQFETEEEWLQHVRQFVNHANMPNQGYVCLIDEHSNFQAYPGFTNEMAAQFSVVPYDLQQDRFQYEMPIPISKFFQTAQPDDVSGEIIENDQLVQIRKFYIGEVPWAVGVHQQKMTVQEPIQDMLPFIVGCGVALFLAVIIPFGIFTGFLIRQHELVRNEHVSQIERHSGEIETINIQLQETNQRLSQMQSEKNRLYARLSHDLRAPLSSIVSACNLVRDGMYGEVTPKQTQAMRRVERNVDVLLQLIDGILQLSRIESGKMDVHLDNVSIAALIQELTENLSPAAESKQITLLTQIDPSLPVLHTDKEKLYLILQNLVNNAVKFTEKGSVTVSAKATEDAHIQIAVSDTGSGIPEQEHQTIFSEFERGSYQEGNSGVGLGLTITKELTELLGGKISISSREGEGSTFSVSFPVSKEMTAASAV